MSKNFISNTRLKLAENRANEAELSFLDNHSHSSSTLSSKNNRAYSQKWAKKQAYIYSWDYTINNKENEDENEK